MSVVTKYITNIKIKIKHWKAIVWFWVWLNGIINYGLVYGAKKKDDVMVVGFVDSKYVGDLDKRKSLSGYLFTLCNCTIN